MLASRRFHETGFTLERVDVVEVLRRSGGTDGLVGARLHEDGVPGRSFEPENEIGRSTEANVSHASCPSHQMPPDGHDAGCSEPRHSNPANRTEKRMALP
jgi:hypothetical protein